ncbi:MAG: hypothetical protein MJ025_01860 [Victivallaceae bacterium]|nr:hypothetical protein [Victivallaceae bacterium]
MLTTALLFVAGGIGLASLAVACRRASLENIVTYERFARERTVGTVLGLVVLLWFARHAVDVFPGTEWLYLAAVVMAVAGWFCLDYLMARAVAGALIVLAYEAIHRSFDLQLPLRHVITLLSWTAGIGGMWISAYPHALRDLFRRCAAKAAVKWVTVAFLAVYALFMLASGAMAVSR